MNAWNRNAVRTFFYLIIQMNTCVAVLFVLAKLPENTGARSGSGVRKWFCSFQVRIIPYAMLEIRN